MTIAEYDEVLKAIAPTWISMGEAERVVAVANRPRSESAPGPLERGDNKTGGLR
jgi:hypothetical protein